MMGVGGACIDFVAPDKGGDHLPAVRMLGEDSLHLGDRCCNAVGVGVIKRETHPEDVVPHKTPVAITLEAQRIVTAAAVKEERIDRLNLPSVVLPRPVEVAPHHMDDTHDHGCHARPLYTLADGKDLAAVGT